MKDNEFVYKVGKARQGFFQDFRQEGANAAIMGLRGGKNYFQGFCHRGNVMAHIKLGGSGVLPLEDFDICNL